MTGPARFLVPTSDGLISPGILTAKNIPCSLACLTKWILLSICLVCLVSRSLLIIAMALLESTKVAMLIGVSGCWRLRELNTCLENMLAVIAKAQALYSASALDSATGFGTNEAASTSEPYMYSRYDPVLLDVSGQSCQDESVNRRIGCESKSKSGLHCFTM